MSKLRTENQLGATLNPYRAGAAMLLKRLYWDLHLESWRSRRELRKLINAWAGQKAVILCNGPSLNNVDFELLSDVYTFGLNKINLIFDRTPFRPSSIVAVNKYVIEQNAEFYNSTQIPLFLDSVGTNHVHNRDAATFLHSTSHRGFAKDCSVSIYQGHTVTFVALQLAFHMGFKSVALVGCDHSFATQGPPNKAVESGQVDPNHFDPNYFSGGQLWQLPDLFESEVAYKMADEHFRSDGRTVVNATEGGELEIFARQNLPSFLAA